MMSIINKKYYNWKIDEGDYQPEYHLSKKIEKEVMIQNFKRKGFRLIIVLLFIAALIAGSAFMLH